MTAQGELHDVRHEARPAPPQLNTPQRPWATSSFSDSAQTSPMDLAALGEHTAQCSAQGGRMVAMRCGAGRLLGFVTARLVSTVAVLAAVVGGLLMWL